MNKLAGSLAVLSLVAGCAPIEGDETPIGARRDALTLRAPGDGHETIALGGNAALTLSAQPVELPTADELPDCWWADSEESCFQLCEDERTATLALRAPVRGSSRAPASRTSVLASSSTSRGPGGPNELTAPEPDDCDVDGVLPCPHCTTSLDGQTRLGNFWVSNGLATNVVIANAFGKFRVASFPALDASLFSLEGEPEIPGTHHVVLDLLAGGDELAASASEPSANQDLYLLFSFGGQVGEFPSPYWMRCPAQGTECEPYFP